MVVWNCDHLADVLKNLSHEDLEQYLYEIVEPGIGRNEQEYRLSTRILWLYDQAQHLAGKEDKEYEPD